MMYRLFRVQILALLAFAILFTTHALASSRSVSVQGEGAHAISGWNVSNLQYQLADDPSMVRFVEFDLDGPAEAVRASVDSTGGVFFNCQETTARHWICSIHSGVSISDIDELRVVAVGGE